MGAVEDDLEIHPDPLDQAAQLSQRLADAGVAEARHRAAPEQVQNADGTWPVTECVECDGELGQRMQLGKIRCIYCQERLEKREAGYGSE